MRHTLSVLVENRFGVLARIAGMFSGRGFNIDTINSGPTHDPKLAHMTIVVRGDDAVLNQVIKQLDKLVDVIHIEDFRDGEYVDRELVLIRVTATPATRAEIVQLCEIFRAKIVDIQPNNLVIEATGHEAKMEKLIRMLTPFGIGGLARTGKVAMMRTEQVNR